MTIAALLLLCAPALADEPRAPPMLEAGPETALLQESVGTWKATTKMWMGPEPTTSSGTQITRSIMGGLGISYAFDSDDPKVPFRGYGFSMWNSTKKKFEGYWFDVHSLAGASQSWGHWDARTRTMHETMTTPMPDGKLHTSRSTTRYVSKDEHVLTFFEKKDGKEVKFMEITYRRAK